MDNMEQMLNSVMSDPETMSKIMAFAQTLGANDQPEQPKETPSQNPFEGIDIGMLQKLSGLAGKSGIDSNQRALLAALRPYIGQHRLARLERAMQAAKMAGMVTGLMGNSF
jgi:hypothetical protein